MVCPDKIGLQQLTTSSQYEKGCVDNCSCHCGAPREDAKHLFLECPLYAEAQRDLMSQILSICPNVNITLHVLLYGSTVLSD